MNAAKTLAPLRKVERCVKKVIRYKARSKHGVLSDLITTIDRELLECGHLFEAPMNLYGTTIGDRYSRRCPHCLDGKPADDLSGWEEL